MHLISDPPSVVHSSAEYIIFIITYSEKPVRHYCDI